MIDMCVEHDYVNATDNIAQYQADQYNRQQVTVEQYMEWYAERDVPVWSFSPTLFEFSLDPWKLVNDGIDQSTTDNNVYFLGEVEVDKDYPLFIQKMSVMVVPVN